MKGRKHEYCIGEVYGVRKLMSLYREGNKSVAITECIYCGAQRKQRPHALYDRKYNSCTCQVVRHGDDGTRLYGIWGNMKYRCNTPTAQGYHNYGGKGVHVCKEWLDYTAFKGWALCHGYSDDLTIDRIDSDGDYCPENCRWISKAENTARANRGSQHRKANKGRYYAISPGGEYYEFDNAAKFGREHSVRGSRIRSAANCENGKNKYMGWTYGYVADMRNDQNLNRLSKAHECGSE